MLIAANRLTPFRGGENQVPKQKLFAMSANGVNELLEAGLVRHGNQRLVFSVSTHGLPPIRFPGGDLGWLAVCGAVNQLAISGARPVALALGLVISEAMDPRLSNELLNSIVRAAKTAGVPLVALDAEVVAIQEAEQICITASAIGSTPRRPRVHADYVAPGDVILVNGPIAEHGVAAMVAREPLAVNSPFCSDVAPLNGLITRVLKEAPGVIFMCDASRGGVARACLEVAARTGRHIRLDGSALPIRPAIRRAAERFGVDPLQVSNAGKALFFVRPMNVERALAALQNHPGGAGARAIGRIEEPGDGQCEVVTVAGEHRVLCARIR